MSDRPAGPAAHDPSRAGQQGSDAVWSIVSTLISGPLVWGLAGYGLDRWLGTSVLVGVGIALGFVLGFYVVHVRFFRDPPPTDPTAPAPASGAAEQGDDR